MIKIIKNLSNKRSKSIDGIPCNVIRVYSDSPCHAIMILLDKIAHNRIFPSKFEDTRVVPVFKKKCKAEKCCNHRPVSVLFSVPKIIESCIHILYFHLFRLKLRSSNMASSRGAQLSLIFEHLHNTFIHI